MASAVYGAKIMKDLGLIPEGYKIMVVGSVQEEDCDGMCWQYIVNKVFNGPEDARSKIEFVISTEPTEVTTKASGRHSGNFLFTLRPIQDVIAESYA